MQQRNTSWMPISAATARLWAFEDLAGSIAPRRRRLVPAIRGLAVSLARLVHAARV